ncbi:hypothetical protein PDJAM_G00071110 [Pangasius djambal]|uniref:Uncharacterized protein n=1 Tax=Pangasius djambal TaxID=1691987 RepID=A0ACC5Z0W4_9TELE|nr:hypothetical protein [Pangasius djambal]
MQVKGQEKEQAALTMDQWRPLKNNHSFFSPSLLSPCRGWKRQTYRDVCERAPLHAQQPALLSEMPQINNVCTQTLVPLLFQTTFSLHYPSFCSKLKNLHVDQYQHKAAHYQWLSA